MPRNTPIITANIRRMMHRFSEPVVYTPGQICPCRVDSGDAQSGCLMCGGTGLWFDDASRDIIKVVFASVEMTRDLTQQGLLTTGDLLLSQIPGLPQIDIGDRIELMTSDGEPFEGETRPRTNDRTVLSYQPVRIKSAVSGDYRTGITRKWSVLNLNNATPYDDPEEYDGTFRWTTDDGKTARWIDWNPRRGPEEGENVSVDYRARFEWIVQNPPKYMTNRDNDLGQYVRLVLKHRLLSEVRDDPEQGAETPTVGEKHRPAIWEA